MSPRLTSPKFEGNFQLFVVFGIFLESNMLLPGLCHLHHRPRSSGGPVRMALYSAPCLDDAV